MMTRIHQQIWMVYLRSFLFAKALTNPSAWKIFAKAFRWMLSSPSAACFWWCIFADRADDIRSSFICCCCAIKSGMFLCVGFFAILPVMKKIHITVASEQNKACLRLLRKQPHRKYQSALHNSLLRTHQFVLVPKLPLLFYWACIGMIQKMHAIGF